MFEAPSVPLWTAIAALAAVGQAVVLIVTAWFVWRYLQETQRLREAAQQQLAVSLEQLEGQAKPALIGRIEENGCVRLVNIGVGPALHIELESVLKGSRVREFVTGIGTDRIAYIEPKLTELTHVQIRKSVMPPNYDPDPKSRSLRCQYRSLSGRIYESVFEFDANGSVVLDTHFGECVRGK
jgi:hypothetical protein